MMSPVETKSSGVARSSLSRLAASFGVKSNGGLLPKLSARSYSP